MTLPTQKWKTKSPWDSSHVVVTELQLNHFTDLPVFLFHSHTVRAGFVVLLPQNTADNPTRQRHRAPTETHNKLKMHFPLESTYHWSRYQKARRSTRTHIIYTALIKMCGHTESSPYLQVYQTHGMGEAVKYDAPFHQGAVQMLKQSYCVISSLLQK